MKQKTITLRQFNECSDELKQKIISNYRDINLDLFNDITFYDESYKLMLEAEGFLNPAIYYDLSCSQGSGACFKTKEFDFDLLLKDYNIPHKKWLISILQNYCECEIYGNSRYTHKYSVNFVIETNFNNNNKRIEKAIIDGIETYIENKRLELSQKLYDDLMNDYDYQSSDEAVIETILANGYYFNEDGEIESED